MPWRHLRPQRNPSLSEAVEAQSRQLGKYLRAPGAMSQSDSVSATASIKFLINLTTRLGSSAHVTGDGREEEKTSRPSSIRPTNSEGPKRLTGHNRLGFKIWTCPTTDLTIHQLSSPSICLKSIPHNPISASDSNSTHEQVDGLDRNAICSP